MKTDYLNAKILSHRANLQRYATLLATQLTELEREYLHKRIEEERAEVASLEFARAAEAAQTKETVTVPNPLPPHASLPVPEPPPGECLHGGLPRGFVAIRPLAALIELVIQRPHPWLLGR